MLPASLAEEFLFWVEKHLNPTWQASYDLRLGVFLQATGRRAYVPFPTLVEHLGASSSLMSHPNGSHRKSINYIGDEGHGMSLSLDTLGW
jgi:hypothetical protein